jgi:hypothetical protein
MRLNTPIAALFMASTLALTAPAHAQFAPAACLAGSDQGNGLELTLDRSGQAHLTHIDRVTGTLYYSRWDVGAQPVRENVALNVSQFALLEVDDTGLTLDASGHPRVCYFDATLGAFRVGLRSANGWALETVLVGASAGDQCDISIAPDGALHTVFHHDSKLKHAVRTGANAWTVTIADQVAGRNLGVDPSMRFAADGTLAVAAGDFTNGELRVSTRTPNGAWSTVASAIAGQRIGGSPRLALDGANVFIAHGVLTAGNQVSDGGLVTTTGARGGPLTSTRQAIDFIGGSTGAAGESGSYSVVTRELQRSALFGNQDGLKLFEGLPGNSASTTLESWPAASARHLFKNVTVSRGPGGRPVTAYLVDVAPSGANAGGAYVCVIRPVDTDNDRLPDTYEATLGTRSDLADTDSDGRSDGLEVLVDGTDPLAAPGCVDTDQDTVCNDVDNCDAVPNLNQADADGDGVGDACDNCAAVFNDTQVDSDNDGRGNACDNCIDAQNATQTDADADGRGDACDNCPSLSNSTQLDGDADGRGDVCDNCLSVANPDQADPDADGKGSACDNCPTASNSGQLDSDADGRGNACDNCSTTPNADQANTDGDKYGNACDLCPTKSSSSNSDVDGDRLAYACDNCPNIANANQTDTDRDTLGDACDNCPSVSNKSQTDTDKDTRGDVCDNCVSVSNLDQANTDGDRYGNVCDNCRTVANNDQTNRDLDVFGDACDNCDLMTNANQTDTDADGVGDSCDNCLNRANADQLNSDADTLGNVCDNCDFATNQGQLDSDGDGIGNACEPNGP